MQIDFQFNRGDQLEGNVYQLGNPGLRMSKVWHKC